MIPGEGGGAGGACAVSGPGGIRDPPGYFTGTRLTS